jgi:hypothetical protein
MKTSTGIVLVVVGLIIIVWGAVGFKTRDNVVDIGPIHASKETTHHIPYAPIAGGLVLLGGAILIGTGRQG